MHLSRVVCGDNDSTGAGGTQRLYGMREIGRDVIDEMQEKVKRLPRREGMSVKTALVYEGHLAPIVAADGYFDAIVPFRRLLGL